jgi:hypothetical protein
LGTLSTHDWQYRKHVRIQLIAVEELLEGRGIGYPRTSETNRTFKKAPKTRKAEEKSRGLFDAE